MPDAPIAGQSKKMLWAGRIISTLVVLMLLFSGIMKLMKPAVVLDAFKKFGYVEDVAFGIGLVEITCTILYIIPATSVLGAILLTGYLGGATETHLRLSEMAFISPIVLGIFVWLGLFLRDPRLRALIPLRR